MTLISLTLLGTAWAIGGVHWITQQIYAVLAAITFLVLWWPGKRGTAHLVSVGRNLHRFPLFWPGLGFLVYVLIGALNPNGEVLFFGPIWILREIEAVTWLPTSVVAPFEKLDTAIGGMNAWRALLFFGSAWMLACAAWAGLSRASLIRLLMILGGGFLFQAGYAILQRTIGTTNILFFYETSVRSVTGTFVYENHGAAFLNLGVGLLLFLAFRDAARRTAGEDGPYLVLGACALFVAFSQLLLSSVLGIIGTIFLLVLGLVLFATGPARKLGNPTLMMAGLVGVIAAMAVLPMLDFRSFQVHMERVESTVAGDTKDLRLPLVSATAAMAMDRPLYGTGPGSFRWRFPPYQAQSPELGEPASGSRMVFRYAHTDPLQFLAEYGIVGSMLIAVVIFGSAWHLIRHRRNLSRADLALLGALAVLAAHSTLDFPLSNPAIFQHAVILGTFLLRHCEPRAA